MSKPLLEVNLRDFKAGLSNNETGSQQGQIFNSWITSTIPIVVRGFVDHWPIVKKANIGTQAALDYLLKFYSGMPVNCYSGKKEDKGRYFYRHDLSGLNFEISKSSLNDVCMKLSDGVLGESTGYCYVGSTTIETCLPGFVEQNSVTFEDSDTQPLKSIWIGNQSNIAAHFDVPSNVACNVIGTRRFTLFPPEQLENLYVGPLDFTPAGQAISLVDVQKPDLQKYPKFKAALDNAYIVELQPGDAIYIPSMWWHAVEGLSSVNGLVNYWWNSTPKYMGSPMAAFEHALLSLRDIGPQQRAAWKNIFDHYVFNFDQEKVNHIPKSRQSILDVIDVNKARSLRAKLINALNR